MNPASSDRVIHYRQAGSGQRIEVLRDPSLQVRSVKGDEDDYDGRIDSLNETRLGVRGIHWGYIICAGYIQLQARGRHS